MSIKQKVIAHLVMWSLIATGIFFAFSFFSARIFFFGFSKFFRIIAAIILLVALYYFISAIILRFNSLFKKRSEKEIVKSGVYGRLVHPTCISAIFLAWMIFFVYSDFRILISDIWMTMVIFCWIEIEKSFFRRNGPVKFKEAEFG